MTRYPRGEAPIPTSRTIQQTIQTREEPAAFCAVLSLPRSLASRRVASCGEFRLVMLVLRSLRASKEVQHRRDSQLALEPLAPRQRRRAQLTKWASTR